MKFNTLISRLQNYNIPYRKYDMSFQKWDCRSYGVILSPDDKNIILIVTYNKYGDGEYLYDMISADTKLDLTEDSLDAELSTLSDPLVVEHENES